jgi:hypothetical protein
MITTITIHFNDKLKWKEKYGKDEDSRQAGIK